MNIRRIAVRYNCKNVQLQKIKAELDKIKICYKFFRVQSNFNVCHDWPEMLFICCHWSRPNARKMVTICTRISGHFINLNHATNVFYCANLGLNVNIRKRDSTDANHMAFTSTLHSVFNQYILIESVFEQDA